MTHKRLIINADDFGLSHEINAGVIRAHRDGIVTSTSIMAGGVAFDDAVSRARECPLLGVGIHLALVDTQPTAPPNAVPSLVAPDGFFWNVSQFLIRLHMGRVSLDEITIEFDAQVNKAFSAGLHLTHLDGHKHLHVHPTILPATVGIANRHDIRSIRLPRAPRVTLPPRALAVAVASAVARRRLLSTPLRWVDQFYGLAETGTLSPAALTRILQRVGPGLSEVMCHPGYTKHGARPRGGRLYRQREMELLTLVDNRIKSTVDELGIELIHYGHI